MTLNPADASASQSHAGHEAAAADARREDARLVQRAQAGDAEAFRALFDRHHRRAFSIAMGVVKRKSDALDIVQEGFIRVHKHLGTFQGTSSFSTWLYRIIMNLAIDHHRRSRRAQSVPLDAVRDDGLAGAALLPHRADGDPGRSVFRKELVREIQAALDALPEHHRKVILLREVEGLSYEEIASVLEVPKGTVMSRLFHARKKLQLALREYIGGQLTIEE